jgi:predicted transcriptional regulator
LIYNNSYWNIDARLNMVADTRTLTAQVPVELAQEVDALSELLERPRQWIIKKALVQYLAREADKRRLIQEGLDDVTAGRLISIEQARAWANSLGTDNELPVPKA